MGIHEMAANVRRLRKERGWTQQELADRVGISVSNLGEIERGATDPAYSTVQAIADEFGWTIVELTGAPATKTLGKDALQIAEVFESLEDLDRLAVKQIFAAFVAARASTH